MEEQRLDYDQLLALPPTELLTFDKIQVTYT